MMQTSKYIFQDDDGHGAEFQPGGWNSSNGELNLCVSLFPCEVNEYKCLRNNYWIFFRFLGEREGMAQHCNFLGAKLGWRCPCFHSTFERPCSPLGAPTRNFKTTNNRSILGFDMWSCRVTAKKHEATCFIELTITLPILCREVARAMFTFSRQPPGKHRQNVFNIVTPQIPHKKNAGIAEWKPLVPAFPMSLACAAINA